MLLYWYVGSLSSAPATVHSISEGDSVSTRSGQTVASLTITGPRGEIVAGRSLVDDRDLAGWATYPVPWTSVRERATVRSARSASSPLAEACRTIWYSSRPNSASDSGTTTPVGASESSASSP